MINLQTDGLPEAGGGSNKWKNGALFVDPIPPSLCTLVSLRRLASKFIDHESPGVVPPYLDAGLELSPPFGVSTSFLGIPYETPDVLPQLFVGRQDLIPDPGGEIAHFVLDKILEDDLILVKDLLHALIAPPAEVATIVPVLLYLDSDCLEFRRFQKLAQHRVDMLEEAPLHL